MSLSSDALLNAVSSDVATFLPTSLRGATEWSSYKEFCSQALVDGIVKKWLPADTKLPDQASLEAFMSANNRCKEWKFNAEWEIDSQVLGETRRILDDFFHPSGELLVSSLYDLIREGRPGPGASVGAIGTSFYLKHFSSPLTATSEYLYSQYRDYVEWIPFFSNAERQRYEKYGSARLVSGSRCTFVPKTNRTSRMVCVEPSVNMFIQLGLAQILERRLRSFFGIDLTRQPLINQRLARWGSKFNSLATIDLSSASDSISLKLCESLLPKWFFELLLLLRSRTTEINGVTVPLFMISTMGNGFTFPLQTIIFSAILLAIRRCYSSSSSRRIHVFGDDIICEASIAKQLVRFLGLLNFSVNPSKTFLEGPFRESCGADWFCGRSVRPVYIRKLASFRDIFVAVNQLNEWSSCTGIFLKGTVSLLLRQLAPKFRTLVPFVDNNDFGIRVPFSLTGRPRFDRNLSYLYKAWEDVPSTFVIGEGSIRRPGWFRKDVDYNPDGLYVSFLYGELVSNKISVRHDGNRVRRRVRVTPYWDYKPISSLYNGVRLDWRRWETAVWVNSHESWLKGQHES